VPLALVAALWQTVPLLLDIMQDTQRGKNRFTKPLKALRRRLASNVLPLGESVYMDSPSIVVNVAYVNPSKPREPLPEPQMLISDARALEQAMLAMDLTLDKLLLPGFDDPLVEAIANDVSITFETRLSRILDAPVFQLR